MRIFTRNSRFPDMLEGDLNSLMAACNLGCKRLEECATLHGVDALENAFEAIISQTETALQQQISAHIPEGSWAFRDRMNSDAVSDRGYFVDVVMRQKKGKLSLDFSPQTARLTVRSILSWISRYQNLCSACISPVISRA